jgi:hypothetical protein
VTLDQHITHTSTSDLSAAHKRRVIRVWDALYTYRRTPEMTPAFAVELLVSIGLREEAARTLVEGVKRGAFGKVEP